MKMNPKIENAQANEMEENALNHKSTEKSNKWNFLIFICCIIFAFLIWCFSTPMTEQDLWVKFVIVDAMPNEVIGPEYAMYTFYGKKAILEEMATTNSEQNPVIIKVKRSAFVNPETGEVLYDTPMDLFIDYTDIYGDVPFHSHDNEDMKFKIYIKLQ